MVVVVSAAVVDNTQQLLAVVAVVVVVVVVAVVADALAVASCHLKASNCPPKRTCPCCISLHDDHTLGGRDRSPGDT